jgi:hypothetical protein
MAQSYIPDDDRNVVSIALDAKRSTLNTSP